MADNEGRTGSAFNCFYSTYFLSDNGFTFIFLLPLTPTLSALHFACEVGSVECVNTLLIAGASPNLQDTGGQHPLFPAALGGHAQCIEAVRTLHTDAHTTHTRTVSLRVTRRSCTY